MSRISRRWLDLELQNLLSSLEEDVQGLTGAVHTLDQTVQQNTADISTNTTDITQLTQNFTDFQTDVETELEGLTGSISDLRDSLESITAVDVAFDSTSITGTDAGDVQSAVSDAFDYVDTALSQGFGQTGPRGLQGATGLPGPQGETGSEGRRGATGAGFTGMRGRQGDTGLPGVRGDTGLSGIPGPQGETGTGVTGPAGPRGETGPLGGPRGETGPRGLQGDTGMRGPRGETGFPGAQGFTGAEGDRGIRGETGAQGVTGLRGLKGQTGPEGLRGETGIGDTGPEGLQGETGLPGIQGERGATGPSGATVFYNTVSLYQAVDSDGEEVWVKSSSNVFTGLEWSRSNTVLTINRPGHGHSVGDMVIIRGANVVYQSNTIYSVTSDEFTVITEDTGSTSGFTAAYSMGYTYAHHNTPRTGGTLYAPSGTDVGINLQYLRLCPGTRADQTYELTLPSGILNGVGGNTDLTDLILPSLSVRTANDTLAVVGATMVTGSESSDGVSFNKLKLGNLGSGTTSVIIVMSF